MASEHPDSRLGRISTNACDACSQRKIRCDKAYPKCDWCTHQGTPCTFTRKLRRQGKVVSRTMNQQRAARLEERISFMENLLSNKLADEFLGKQINISTESDADQSQMKGLSSIQQSFFTLAGEGSLSYDKHGCCDSDPTTIIPQARKLVLSVLGHSVNLQGLFQPSPPWQCYESEYVRETLPVPRLMKLPDISIINDCVAAYFSSSVRFLLPIIDRTLFKNTINLAFSASSADYPGTSAARACIWAFLSLSSMWNFPGMHVLPVNASTHAAEVENYMPRILQEDTIDGLQTLLMLLVFHSSSGNLRNGLFLDSLVARLIYRFGAHVKSPPASEFFHENHSSPVDYHLRNLFWIAYILDKELCIRMGQPAAIPDEACDLTLPPGYEGQLAALSMASECDQLEPRGHLYLTDLRLIKIKSRVYSAIYGPAALHKPDADLLRSIRELDEELEQWRLSIPSQHRPSLSRSPQQMTDASPHIRMHTVLLQVDYYHCMAILHQACGRSKAWTSGETNGVDGIGTSFRLAVESSRSSLLFLRNVLPTLPEGTFWALMFYPMSACLMIFGNLILSPLDPRTAEDLTLLDSTASLIRGLPTHSRSVHMKRLVDLVTELSGLAKLAVNEARTDQFLFLT